MRPALALLLLAACSPSVEATCDSVSLNTSLASLKDTRRGEMCSGHPARGPFRGPVEPLLCCRRSSFTSTTCGITCERFDGYAYGPSVGDRAFDVAQCCLLVRDGRVIATYIAYD